MSDLHEKRVEAVAEVLLRDYQSEYDGGEVSEFLDLARAVLEVADAVVTEEMIAKVLWYSELPAPEGSWERLDSLTKGGYRDKGARVLALFKEVEQ